MNNSLFKKKLGLLLFALTLAFSCTSAVSATGNNSEFTPSVTYSKGDYTFGKSHTQIKRKLQLMVSLIT